MGPEGSVVLTLFFLGGLVGASLASANNEVIAISVDSLLVGPAGVSLSVHVDFVGEAEEAVVPQVVVVVGLVAQGRRIGDDGLPRDVGAKLPLKRKRDGLLALFYGVGGLWHQRALKRSRGGRYWHGVRRPIYGSLGCLGLASGSLRSSGQLRLFLALALNRCLLHFSGHF